MYKNKRKKGKASVGKVAHNNNKKKTVLIGNRFNTKLQSSVYIKVTTKFSVRVFRKAALLCSGHTNVKRTAVSAGSTLKFQNKSLPSLP